MHDKNAPEQTTAPDLQKHARRLREIADGLEGKVPPEILRDLRAAASGMEGRVMQNAPEQTTGSGRLSL
jgi:hypothetical protein